MRLIYAQIAELIEERYRERGEDYYERGMVELTKVSAAKATAKCAGTRVYKTQLELKGGKLTGVCSCPAFEDFGPCKHMAAVAYALMEKHYAPSEEYEDRKEETERLEKHLMKKSKSELVSLIMQISQDTDYAWMVERDMEE